MDDFDIPEDDFETLYEQELEMMREMSAEYEETFPSDSQLNDVAGNTEVDDGATIIPENNSAFTEVKRVSTIVEDDTTVIPEDNSVFKEVNKAFSVENDLESEIFTAKKRLFDDLTNDPVIHAIKRRKTVLPQVGYEIRHTPKIDPDLEMIDRILSHRKAFQTNDYESSANAQSRYVHKKRKHSFFRRIPHGDFQSITTDEGIRIYLNVEDEKSFEESIDRVGHCKDQVRLLSVSYNDLRNEAEKELLALNPQITEENVVEMDKEEFTEDDLWVNKYKPRNYLDLLSDESTNRTVLHWIKLWDKIVFGFSKLKTKEKPKEKTKFFTKFAPEVVEEFDEIGRPIQKAVLLCGPPGLGKTTLAHIIANHAGYNAVEMNASDDRSVDTFKTNLENATTMKSVFGNDKRPNCLIIDEIDGAPAASINFLVNLLQAKKGKNEPSKKKDKFTLFRPVICICNDLYAPALRPLRQISLVIQFPPTQSTRLAQRLLSISRKQDMKADLSILLALCNKTENDIRACLSVLQFVRITTKEVKFMDLNGVSVGQKDYQRSLFSVWHSIFTLPRHKNVGSQNPHAQQLQNEKTALNYSDKENVPPELSSTKILSFRFSNILKLAQSCGEYDKLTQGWFENYLHMKFKHTHLEPVVEGLEWAVMTDIFQKEILRSQSWNLGAYIPLSFVAYHFLFASNSWPKLQFPNQYNEFSTKLTKSNSILTTLINGISAYNLFFSASATLVRDILPFLTYIMQPNLRAVNVQLYSSKEREELMKLVNIMISYNLTYQQEKSPDGTYAYVLDPYVEELTNFSNIPKSKSISYSSKQLIAREIELEKVRRSEKYFNTQPQNLQSPNRKSIKKGSDVSKKETKNPPEQTKAKNSSVPNHLQKLEAKKLAGNQLNIVAKDFFGRIITSVKNDKTDDENNILSSSIWFKFKEGYSNAVRRTYKVKNFF